MSDAPDKTNPDYRSTVFLPKTDFPMKAGLPQKEPAILARWIEQDLYGQLRKARAGRDKFILHDGPPYANGDIHIGHTLNKVLKDMVVRSQTLLGKDVPYIPGWDCHGLPIEWKIEEQYRKKKLDKDEVPLAEFRAECRAYAQHWVKVQSEQFQRLGITGDWANPYLTMDFDAEATIVAELMKFAESGQLYRGAKPVMWSPVEKTALAEAEIEYEDIVSTQIDVAFEIVEAPKAPNLKGLKVVIWTTTPWTIPVNQAIGYNPEVTYVILNCVNVLGGDPMIIVAEELLEPFLKRTGLPHPFDTLNPDDYERDLEVRNGRSIMIEPAEAIVGKDSPYRAGQLIKGSIFEGAIARHPMHHLGGFFAKPRPFLAADFVTTDQGTGLVHEAPDHGEEDFYLCQEHGIDPVFAVTDDGRYRDDWLWLGSQGSVINTKFNAPDGPICSDLREAGALLAASADFQHSYPHSWRSKAKVIYRCTPQWFIAMDRPIDKRPFKSLPERRWENEGGAVLPASVTSEVAGEGATLRETAVQAIADTRFVPEKGRNRLHSMVAERPDWVISRQRAWGVPIALFVDRKTGEPLVNPEVNQRIVEAVRENGVDAWDPANAAQFLGNRNPAEYEMVRDILDVWFDSGCTHVFTLESGRWPDQRWPADLYLEGSDQHRGWFQSSLLESCGTRGRAPYDAVLTHGFTMDSKGMKMSKSLGNVINPLELMKEHGADILRLWALSVDFTEDHRIGKEILGGVADQYRKLRNTFRYLLGALEGFSEDERVDDVSPMPELERYVLHLLAELDATLKAAVEGFDYNTYVRAITDFCNEDLSAFYFDIRKDVLYCEANPETGFQTDKRRQYRSVLNVMFSALVRWLAPVLVFTTEEAWGTRAPEAGSVHLLEWPDINSFISLLPDVDEAKWARLRELRTAVTEAIEPLRRDKVLGSSLEAEVTLPEANDSTDLAELFIVSAVHAGDALGVAKTSNRKCGRCWRHLPEVTEEGGLCARCEEVLNG